MGSMLRKIVVGLIVVMGTLSVAVAGFVWHLDRQMDSHRLVERLVDTPVPPTALVLVGEHNMDGSWLFGYRVAEAGRDFVATGSVDEMCAQLDAFYRVVDMRVRPVGRSDDPDAWCGRGVDTPGGAVSISVEAFPSWRTPPGDLAERHDVLQISYHAYP